MAYLLFADYSRRKGIPSEFRVTRSMLGLHGTPSRRVGDHLSSIHRLTGGSLHEIKLQGRHDVDLGRSKDKVWDPTLTAQRSCPLPQDPTASISQKPCFCRYSRTWPGTFLEMGVWSPQG
jgi:hypothetical protein